MRFDRVAGQLVWEMRGPFGGLAASRARGRFLAAGTAVEMVRVGLYAVTGSTTAPRYRFVKELVRDVPALPGSLTVNPGIVPEGPRYVLAVSRQGTPDADRLSALTQGDWETFGVTQEFAIAPLAAPAARAEKGQLKSAPFLSKPGARPHR